MRFGSLFAGVGGFDIGLEAAGWECGFQVEWDAHCQQTLAHHWPDVPRWGDVCDVNGAELPLVDVITFGSPCQDLSVAGKRAGLAGGRSGLFFEATRIIREMRDATGGTFPRYAIWENVVGALSSNGGDDFEAVLGEMVGLGATHVEWAVLDAQFFGVPQRRRRVFVVACFDPSAAGRSRGEIFAVGEGRSRDSAKGKQSREDSAGTVARGAGGSGEGVAGYRLLSFGEYADDDQASCIQSRDYKYATDLIVEKRSRAIIGSDIVGPLAASDWKFPQQQQVHENKLVTQQMQVRRLTPIECERLMGWPDNHTLHRADGKTNSDSTRYKMCGNGVASPVAQWIAEQIDRFDTTP